LPAEELETERGTALIFRIPLDDPLYFIRLDWCANMNFTAGDWLDCLLTAFEFEVVLVAPVRHVHCGKAILK